ncbi:MAG: PLP-dependent transferase [Alphaproteobacteria bacterium]|nr:PLP-dependent transferase [Alphaproteobacteria bacterium]
MADDAPWRPATRAAQALGAIEAATGAITPGIQPSTTFLRDPDNAYRRGFSYGRDTNPTYRPAEELLADLEGGAAAMLFASGMAAATAAFQALAPGDHVVAPKVMYWSLRNWLATFAVRWGLAVTFVAMDDLAALAAAVVPGRTKLVWVETPANPTWVVTDIAAVAAIAHRAGARLAVDNTVATPFHTRPIGLGADLVMHAATKALNGHSDVVAGALIAAHHDEFWDRIRVNRQQLGGILGSFEAWLLLRGMRTLFVRVPVASGNAAGLAARLATHPRVRDVLYPGLPNHPGHAIAARQMSGGFGALLSIRVVGGAAAAIATAARVQLWKRATSLGGVESLIEHRASVEGADTPAPDDMLRLAVGIEDVDDLYRDLDQTLMGNSGP